MPPSCPGAPSRSAVIGLVRKRARRRLALWLVSGELEGIHYGGPCHPISGLVGCFTQLLPYRCGMYDRRSRYLWCERRDSATRFEWLRPRTTSASINSPSVSQGSAADAVHHPWPSTRHQHTQISVESSSPYPEHVPNSSQGQTL